jgi:hypothetical protein
MQASLAIPEEATLVTGENPKYLGFIGIGQSRVVNWTLTFSAGGVFNLDVNASGIRVDLDLYVEKHGSTNVTITDQPPDVSIISPENTTYPNSFVPLIYAVNETIHWSGYSLDGGANVTISGNTTITGLVDGPHSITVYANDSAGNMGASEAVQFTIIDTTPPIITLITPLNETYSTIAIPLTYYVNEVLSWTAYSLDHGANVTITGNTTLTGLGEGSHNIRIYGTDIATNTADSAVTYFSFEICHDVSVLEVYTSKEGCQPFETVAEGNNCTVFAVIQNPGSFTETFNVTIYANDTEFDHVEISLVSGETTTLTFIWDTSVFNKGNYTLEAYAWPVPEEAETVDNTAYSPKPLLLTIAGDVDGDREVDIFDIVRMANCYGVSSPSPRYDPNCDLDDDGDIDIFDIVLAASNYSKTW